MMTSQYITMVFPQSLYEHYGIPPNTPNAPITDFPHFLSKAKAGSAKTTQ